MNRRTILAASGAAVLTPVLRFPTRGLAASVSQVASPATRPVVADVAEVGPEYEALRAELLAQGREVADLLFSDEAATLYERLSPAVKALVTRERLASLAPSLGTNRVHFELPQFGAIFDGYLEGRTIEGFFSQGEAASFTLTAEAGGTPSAAAPVAGLWQGEIVAGATKIGIAVSFRAEGHEFSGTISIPEQQLIDLPLANVSFKPTTELGERYLDQALPWSPTNRAYLSRYDWGTAALAVSIGVAADGQVAALSVAPEWPLPPDPAANYESAVTYRLPFNGVWLVSWGGDTVMQNYHVAFPGQRHAYDIDIWKDGGTYRGNPNRNENYWAFGQPLFAPAAGTVVAIRDGIPDNRPGVLNPEPHPAGNHVVIQTAEREFVYLAHLRQGSVRVREGDRLGQGDLLGLSGNSGNSSEAHLHIHVQDKADFFAPDAVGLPLRFSGYLANGEEVTTGVP